MKRSREVEEASQPGSPVADEIDSAATSEQGEPSAKITELDVADPGIAMRCSLPPHKEAIAFDTYDEYESHYRKDHSNRCLECHKNFPTGHLLGVHIEECHDSFMAVKREKGEHTYSCFVEGCERKCLTPQKRRMHLIDKHLYPKNFFFAVTRDGIDGRRSLLIESGHHRRRSSTSNAARRRSSIQEGGKASQAKDQESRPKETPAKEAEAPEDPEERPDVEMNGLADAMSSLKFVPSSLRFGRGGRAGFARH